MKIKSLVSMALLALSIVFPVAQASAQTPDRFLGAVTAINGNTLMVKSDAGGVHRVNVPATASIKRITPGQKDLSAAEAIPFSTLETGDRVLVKLDPDAPAGTEEALQIIAVKQADLAQKQQKERADWQQRGVGGLVKSVDPASGNIVLTNGVGIAAKSIVVHTTKATMLKRYAPASVRFDQAQPAPIEAIRVGDQLRARGTKNAEATEIAAEEVVSGSFRNLSGTIASLDGVTSTLVIKDLATKKQVTVHITADAQMRRLPERMAKFLAIRLKGTASGSDAKGGKTSAAKVDVAGQQHDGAAESDPEQMLDRAPAIQFADLKKDDAVMLVATDGATGVTAITLLAGVEPLLEAPAASQNLLNNWSIASGSSEAMAQ